MALLGTQGLATQGFALLPQGIRTPSSSSSPSRIASFCGLRADHAVKVKAECQNCAEEDADEDEEVGVGRSRLQVPSTSCSLRAQSSRMPVVQSSGLRRFRASSRTLSQRCNSVSKSRGMEELQGSEFDQLGEEELDALFEDYGETVRDDVESSEATSEVDEDSDSLALAVALAEAANDVKGSEIQVLFVKPLIYWARFFVVVTAFSKPQIDAVGKRMRDASEEKFSRSPRGDSKPNAWTLLDYGDVVVHIFLPKEREFYNLEEFYGNATLVPLPFENRSMQ